jgi:hypothetical protein
LLLYFDCSEPINLIPEIYGERLKGRQLEGKDSVGPYEITDETKVVLYFSLPKQPNKYYRMSFDLKVIEVRFLNLYIFFEFIFPL